MNGKQSILVVDDIKDNIDVLHSILKDDYQIRFALSGRKALELAKKHKPDLILLDVMMPEMDGFTVCSALKNNPLTKGIPVIFVTANNEAVDEVHGFELGAVDYIAKPVTPVIVKARVRTHLQLANQKQLLYQEVKQKTEEIFDTQVEIINVLGRAAEYKDNETGKHVQRVGAYSYLLARAIGIEENEAELLMLAAPMHDVGKIGIADNILKKPGRLDDNERNEMNLHAEIGGEIIGQQTSEILKYARIIAEQHHEKWDGSGYPNGIKQEEIHIYARIVALADVFDALTSKRPYKEAWSIEKATGLIESEGGKHFDPSIVALFIENIDGILKIRESYKDDENV